MGEMVNFLYGQPGVGSVLEQFFRRPFFAVSDLHDFRIATVHTRAVAHFVHGFAAAVDAKECSLRSVVCRKGKSLFLFRLRRNRLFFRGRERLPPACRPECFPPVFLRSGSPSRRTANTGENRLLVCAVWPCVPILYQKTGRRREGGATRHCVPFGRVSAFRRYQ